MKYTVLRALAGMVLLAGSTAGIAATMDITASFSPSMDNPENNVFTNTTPQSGFCATWPSHCSNGEKSLATGLTLTPLKGLTPQDDKRESLFFKWPSSFRQVTVTHTETGELQSLQFRVSSFSGRYDANSDGQVYNWNKGNSAFSMSPQGGCSVISIGWLIGDTSMAWLWGIPEGNTGCYGITSVERPIGAGNFINRVAELSFGYELLAPNPLSMASGIYSGTLTLSVGPGGDIDFGDNFQASDTELTINFTLSVNHELKLTTTEENRNVSLQPCSPGGSCSEEEGKANWERWMVTRITPQLTGRSNFNLSSSGTFTVYLECGVGSPVMGADCGLRSDNNPSQVVRVETLLTLPDNIVDNNTGSVVSKRRLRAGKQLAVNVFETKSFGQNKTGSIDFLVDQKSVDSMLKTRPDTYRGTVTVIFDPKIF